MHSMNGIEISKEMFPVIFVSMWLIITTLMSFASGWLKLMQIYPDSKNMESIALSVYKYQSAFMGHGVHLRGILTFETFKHGLRIKTLRLLFPLSKNIFIPWSEIKTEKKHNFFGDQVLFTFGSDNLFLRMTIQSQLANKIYHDAGVILPEIGVVPDYPSNTATKALIFKEWLAGTVIASVFFIVVPRVLDWSYQEKGNSEIFPSVLVAILFPATVFGIASIIKYYSSIKR